MLTSFPFFCRRPAWVASVLLLLSIALLQAALPTRAAAVTPAMYPGQTDNFPSDGSTSYLGVGPGSCEIMDANGNDVTSQGWSITYAGTAFSGSFKVAAPASASGSYTAAVGEKSAGDNGYSGLTAAFRVVTPPSPRPPAFPGPAYGWQGSVGGVNTGNGNKVTSIPIVSWKQRGGLPVDVTLYHNSETSRQGWLGPKWTFTQDVVLSVSGSVVTVAWGNGRTYSFAKQADGTYQPPPGIYDTLSGSGASWTLKTTSNVTYQFAGGYGNGIVLVSITDLNGNAVTINRNSSGQPNYVQDCTGRRITFGYDGTGRLFTITDPLMRKWTLGYDGTSSSSNLTSVALPTLSDQNGQNSHSYGIQIVPDGGHNIHQYVAPSGKTLWYANYNGDSSVQNIGDAYGRSTTFAYPSAAVSITDPKGRSYSALTTTITDANNHTVTHFYVYGTLMASQDALGNKGWSYYDGNNSLYLTTDPRGYSTNNAPYLPRTNATASYTQDADGNTTSATYDSGTSKVTSQTDGAGKITQYKYDGSWNLTQTLDPLLVAQNAKISYFGGWHGLVDSAVDANGHTTSFGYDNSATQGSSGYSTGANQGLGGYGILTSTQDPNGLVTSSHYSNALGWTDWSKDPQGNQTSFAYDSWGRVVATTAPDGTVTTTEYDPDGNVVSVNGGYNRPYAIRAGQGAGDGWGGDGWYSASGTYAYSGAVNTSLVSNAAPQSVYQGFRDGADFSYSLPNLYPGRLYTVRLHFNEPINYSSGTRVFSVSVNGTVVLPSFDVTTAAGGNNRAVIRDFAAKADGSGVLTIRFQHVSGSGPYADVSGIEVYNRGVTNQYDLDNRLVSVTNGRGDTVTYGYDGKDGSGNTQYGLQSWKTDGNGSGHTTYYAYTARDEVSATFYPDNTSESATYDEDGNVHIYTLADGNTITYAYDPNDLLINVTYSNPLSDNGNSLNHAATFTYDVDNRRHTMTDGIGAWQWDYDSDSRLFKLTSPYNTVSYNYYPANAASYRGLLSSMTEGNGVGTWNYTTYDNDNNLIGMTNPSNETTLFHYDGDGRKDQVQNAIHQWTTYGYNALSQTTSVKWGTGANDATFGWENYTFDAAGQMVEKDQNDGSVTRYGHDGASQLTWEQRVGGPAVIAGYGEEYTYDHNANRLSKRLNGTMLDSYSYDTNNKLQSVQGGISGSRTYGYDQNGNTTSVNANGTTTTLRWDDEGHPYWIGQGNGQFSTYSYSGLGQRAFYHSANGVNHYNTFSGEDPAASLLSDGTATYTPGISEHRASDNASHYYASDTQGSLRFLRDSNGNASEDSRYDGFGVSAYKQNAPTTPFGFVGAQGYHTDFQDSNLSLLGNRYYDAGVGRFLSQDPSGDGNNWYAYCDNDPLDYSDPEGLSLNASSPYAPVSVGAAYENMLENDNGFDGTIEETRTKTTITYMDTYPSGQRVIRPVITYGPWVVTGFSGNFQLVSVSPLGRFTELVASAAKRINNILHDDVVKHINGAIKQIDNYAGHRREMIEKFGRDYNHIKDLQDKLNGLRNGVRTLEKYGGNDYRGLVDSAQNAIKQIEDAFRGFGI